MRCPACHGRARVEQVPLGKDLRRCGACDSCFYDPPVPEPSLAAPSPDLYVEQGAGIDVMLAPLFRIDPSAVETYLEVGCGFGFSLDFARHAFGWRVLGVDPSPLARAGSAALGLEISGELPPGRFDLVYGSEVVEHVPDPGAFLASLAQRLEERGVLALTTPNAAAIRPETPPGTLFAVLSPGSHLVILSAKALRELLRRAGLEHVRVEERGHSLHAFASRRPLALRDSGLDRERYLAWLDARTGEGRLEVGLAWRRFKERVNLGRHEAARADWDALVAAVRRVHGYDLERASGEDPPDCLTGAFFFRGILALNAEQDHARALACFEGAERAARALRARLRARGADDGETEDLAWQARRHAALALAHLDPERAVAAALAVDAFADEIWTPPRGLRELTAEGVLRRLTDLGHLSSAARLRGKMGKP